MEYATDAYKEVMQANVRGKSYVWAFLDLTNIYAQESAKVTSSFTGMEDGIYDDSEKNNVITSTESDGSIVFTFGNYTKLLLSGVRFILNGTFNTITVTNGSQSKTVNVVEDEVMVDYIFTNCHYIKLTPNTGNLSIKKIYFGKRIEFNHEQIMDTGRRNMVKHLNDDLPLKEFNFTVHNYDRLWNSDNPESLSRFVMAKQKITYRYGRDVNGDIYEINGGVVYLSNFSSDDYKATFEGVGYLDFIQDDYNKGAFYPDGITLYQLAEFVMIDAGITKYKLDACLRTFKVTNPLPKDTHKACLQMIAHAGRCVLYEDRDGAVCIKSVDRPEILKTAVLHDETIFSRGDDVITTTTVANYGSTEPEYTKADGLHYFYPEKETGIDNHNYIQLPYDSSSETAHGLTYTVNNDGSISVNGVIADGHPYIFWIHESEFTVPPGKYVFGGAADIYEAIGGSLYIPSSYVKLRYLDENGRSRDVNSSDEYADRIFKTNGVIKLVFISRYGDTRAIGNTENYTFYPQLYSMDASSSNTIPVGFVSEEYAKSNGTFDSTPQIDINFASPSILSEVVLNCAVAPKDLQIKTYLQGTQKSTQSITNNTSPQIVLAINDIRCDKVTITFSKTTAGQRIHVNNVELGAKVDYEITYKDMTSTPTATKIEKISAMDFQLYAYSDPTDINASNGISGVTVVYSELQSGGQAIDITTPNTLAYFHVKPGLNEIELSGRSIAQNVEYSDDIEGGTVTIIESGAYYATVNASREGDIIITGIDMLENVYSYKVPVNEIGSPVKVDNPLISTKEHADKLKDWFLDYYDNDVEYRISYRGDPILDAHDQIFLENKYVVDNLIRIESEQLSTSGGMDTANQITARRTKYSTASKTVLRDFILNHDVLYLDGGQNTILAVAEWIPSTVTNKTITWTSSDPSIVAVDANGKVMPVSIGEATITARAYNGLSHTCRVISTATTVILTDFVLSETEISLAVGSSKRLYVVEWTPTNASLKTVTWSSSDDSIATVDSNGNVNAVDVGTVVITATSPDGVSKACTVTATSVELSDFTLSANTATLKIGETKQLTVTSWTPSNATDKIVAWSTSDDTIATVSEGGLVTALDDGHVAITATSLNDITKTCAVNVYHVEVTDFTLSKSTLAMQIGDIYQLSVTSWIPSNARYKSVTWSTSDATKATVSSDGTVTALEDGTVIITATCPDGISRTCEITVSDVAVIDFTLSSSSETVYVDDTLQLLVTSWVPSNATHKTVTWTTSDDSIATVSANGLVTAVSDGNVTITATCPDGISKTCSIVVPYVEITNFTLSSYSATLAAGDTFQLYVTSWSPADATDPSFTWSSSDTSIATVSNNGLVTAVADGFVVITATSDNGISKNCSVNVQTILVTDFTLSRSSASIDVGNTLALSVTSWTPQNAVHKTVTWTSSDTSKATVSATGVVTALSEGNVTITATCPDGISKTCAIAVNAIAVTNFTISESSILLDVGETQLLSVTSWTPSNATYKTVTWSSSDTTKATVSNTGLVTAIADGNVTITATCPDGISQTCSVAISHVEVTDFTLSQSSATVNTGDTLQLSVSSWTPNNATYKTVTWSSSDTTKATVSNTGLVSGLARGNVTITATCPDGVSKTCAINVYEYVAVTDFTLSQSSASLDVGDTLQLSVTSWTPSDATTKSVTWSTSDATKATVSSDGLVTVIASGNVTITATHTDGVSKTCVLTISNIAVTDFTLSASSATISVNDTYQLSVTSWTPSNASQKTITWTSSNTSKATVSNNGLVTAVSSGSATITATCPDGVSKTCTMTIEAAIGDINCIPLPYYNAPYTHSMYGGSLTWTVYADSYDLVFNGGTCGDSDKHKIHLFGSSDAYTYSCFTLPPGTYIFGVNDINTSYGSAESSYDFYHCYLRLRSSGTYVYSYSLKRYRVFTVEDGEKIDLVFHFRQQKGTKFNVSVVRPLIYTYAS